MAPVYAGTAPAEQDAPAAVPSAVQDLAAAAVALGSTKHAHLLPASSHHEHTPDGGSAATPLENDANKCRQTPPASGLGGAGDRLREQRWAAMRVLWDLSTLKRVSHCRRVVARAGSGPVLRVTEAQAAGEPGSAGLAGLQTCGSVWSCPICSARIQGERRRELVQLVEGVHAEGGCVALVTRTVRHRKGQALVDLCGALGAGHRAVGKDKRVRRLREQLGFIGYVRSREITHGQHGWHPHDHSLYLFAGIISPEQLAELQALEVEVWAKRAAALGLQAPLSKAQDARLVSQTFQADYLAKAEYGDISADAMAFEMSGNATKSGKGSKSRTPWQILAAVVEDGDADDLELWWEYEAATKGMRALTWSRGLKAAYGIGEKSDEEIAEEDEGGTDVLELDDWEELIQEPRVVGQLLNAARWGGAEAAVAFCEEHGIAWSPPRRGPDDG